MQKSVILDTKDGKRIYGTLDITDQASQDSDGNSLIIFVHGLTGFKDESHYFNAAPYFNEKGYDVFRFNLYCDEENARRLSDCSIKTHTDDLNVVISHFERKYRNIYLVGHSLGAVSVIAAHMESIKKIVLWDPSRGMKSLEDKSCEYVHSLDKYVLNWQMQILINEQMVNDWKEASNIGKIVERIKRPCKLIFAEESGLLDGWKPFVDAIKVQHSLTTIPHATHTFVEKGVQEILYKETLHWIAS